MSEHRALSVLKSKNSEIIFTLFLLTFIGLFFSRFLLSVSMISLFVFALLQDNLISNAKQFFKSPAFVLITAVFFLGLLSFLNTENSDYYLNRIRLKLPFLILPFAFFSLKDFSKTLFNNILYFFFVLVCCISVVLLCIYGFNFDYYNEIYGAGRIIPTPIQHIRFSLLSTVAFSAGIYLLFNNHVFKYNWEKGFIVLACVFLIIFLHILAVRSGLLALYAVLIYTAVIYFIRNKNLLIPLSILILLPLFGYFAMKYIPTLKSKIGYTIYTFEEFAKMENIRNLSDTRRIGSIYAGIDLGKNNPLFGVGLGDIKDETNVYLSKHFPGIKDLDLLPHNQFVFYFAVSGILGLFAFTICAFVPGLYYSAYKDYFYMSVTIIFFTSFLVEHTIETQLGTASYLLFLLMSLTYLRTKSLTHG